MNRKDKVLIAGTGPVSIQVAINIKKWELISKVGIVGRDSKNSRQFLNDLMKYDYTVEAHIQNKEHFNMLGKAKIDYFNIGYNNILGKWNTLILTVTNDAYSRVLKQIPKNILKEVENIVLISSCIGSTAIIKGLLKEIGLLEKNIMTLSTYYADTKRLDKFKSHTRVLTKNVKKKIYCYSNNSSVKFFKDFIIMLKKLGIDIQELRNSYEVEARSISTYVHPSMLMNNIALNNIFNPCSAKKYIYKLYPEGPITQYVVKDMLGQLDDINLIFDKIKVKRFNFLKFLNDDNYPVLQESISRKEIESFDIVDRVRQEYLIYIRYTSILIDPYSTPDKNGRYFDFSAVEMQKVYKNSDNKWSIPRAPKEDYYRLNLLKGIGDYYNLSMPTINRLVNNYEKVLSQFKNKYGEENISKECFEENHEEDIRYIKSTL